MLSRRLLRDSRQLRESYIEISNYFRAQSRVSSRPRFQCNRLCPSPPRFSTSAAKPKLKSIEHDLQETGGDVTKGFPDLPNPDELPKLAVNADILQNKGLGHEVGDGVSDRRIPLETRQFLAEYKRRHHLVKDAYPWDFLEFFRDPPVAEEDRKIPVKVYGFISSSRNVRDMVFYQLVDPHLRRSVQVMYARESKPLSEGPASQPDGAIKGEALPNVDGSQPHYDSIGQAGAESVVENSSSQTAYSSKVMRDHKSVSTWKPHTPVLVTGYIVRRDGVGKGPAQTGPGDQTFSRPRNTRPVRDPYVGNVEQISHLEIHAESITELNTMPDIPLPKSETNLSPDRRHLQFRIDSSLRNALRLRSKVMAVSRKFLFMKGFDEIETPLLFKSTPEGAREFIVPTRTRGMAYALPQSPQQYKQILMASGVARYFQFAKCFRDEDMRADRQPEFTQLDLEMSFARREDVMIVIERLVAQSIWPGANDKKPFEKALQNDPPIGAAAYSPSTKLLFPQYTYHQAMSMFGSDKPDPRLGSEIHRVDSWVPQNLKGMLSSLEDPIIEIMKIDMNGTNVNKSSQFMTNFLDAASSAVYIDNPAGTPGITVYNPKKPTNGLASFGHEGAAKVEELLNPEPGDIIIVQARPRGPFTGGSTPLGNLRRDIHHAAATQGFRPVPKHDSFIWVTDFPLFSPIEDDTPGQGGGAGICSTHHPFTAPRGDQDLKKLFTAPLEVIGDHYDLVINGVEVGGGSRRIHDAKMQELIFRDVLRMKKNRIEDFRHLLNALESGCPPHAGFALGFDRLMALALGRGSVRDVIAFPKWGSGGEDKMVGSPSKMSEEVLGTYHLKVRPDEVKPGMANKDAAPKISLKA